KQNKKFHNDSGSGSEKQASDAKVKINPAVDVDDDDAMVNGVDDDGDESGLKKI
ncbi:hypothetical protein A2U01_0042813, partial [Trifolium medium]|nr:hypothetical protein [Trifolium medium]